MTEILPIKVVTVTLTHPVDSLWWSLRPLMQQLKKQKHETFILAFSRSGRGRKSNRTEWETRIGPTVPARLFSKCCLPEMTMRHQDTKLCRRRERQRERRAQSGSSSFAPLLQHSSSLSLSLSFFVATTKCAKSDTRLCKEQQELIKQSGRARVGERGKGKFNASAEGLAPAGATVWL